MEITTTSGTSNVAKYIHVEPLSFGVLSETSERLRYWRATKQNTLETEETNRLLEERGNIGMTITAESVRDEALALLADAGFLVKDAIAANDWTAEESQSRHYDYEALVALARSRMLEEFARLLEAKGRDEAQSAATQHGL